MDKPAMKLYEACNNLTRLKLANPLASYSSTGRSHHPSPEQPFFPRERSLRSVMLCSSMLFFCFNFYEFLHLPLVSLCLLRRPTPQKWQIRLLTEHRVTHWLSRANPLQFWKFEHLEREREKIWKGRKKPFTPKWSNNGIWGGRSFEMKYVYIHDISLYTRIMSAQSRCLFAIKQSN